MYILHGEFDRGVFKGCVVEGILRCSSFCRHDLLSSLSSPAPHTQTQPLSKQDKFYLGHPTTTEYATQFENIGTLERWGIEFLKDGLSIGSIHFGKVWKGIKRLVFGGGKKSTGDEL